MSGKGKHPLFSTLVHACSIAQSCAMLSLRPHGPQPAKLLCLWNFPGKNTRGVAFPTPGDLAGPGIEPESSALPGRLFTTEPPGNPFNTHAHNQFLLLVIYSGIPLTHLLPLPSKPNSSLIQSLQSLKQFHVHGF